MDYAAYRTDIKYRFGLTLIRGDGDEERYGEVITNSPTFCNVLTAIKAKYPGWSLWESWELPLETDHQQAA